MCSPVGKQAQDRGTRFKRPFRYYGIFAGHKVLEFSFIGTDIVVVCLSLLGL